MNYDSGLETTAFLMFENEFRYSCLRNGVDEPKDLRGYTIEMWDNLTDFQFKNQLEKARNGSKLPLRKKTLNLGKRNASN